MTIRMDLGGCANCGRLEVVYLSGPSQPYGKGYWCGACLSAYNFGRAAQKDYDRLVALTTEGKRIFAGGACLLVTFEWHHDAWRRVWTGYDPPVPEEIEEAYIDPCLEGVAERLTSEMGDPAVHGWRDDEKGEDVTQEWDDAKSARADEILATWETTTLQERDEYRDIMRQRRDYDDRCVLGQDRKDDADFNALSLDDKLLAIHRQLREVLER